jgi:hypothetical protein
MGVCVVVSFHCPGSTHQLYVYETSVAVALVVMATTASGSLDGGSGCATLKSAIQQELHDFPLLHTFELLHLT